MAGGLVGLLDDIAALAKLAATSIDDIGAAAGRASVKAAGVVIDDTAVTPAYVQGLAAERELPIVKKIAVGSLRNKLLLILPAALVLSAISGRLVEVVLMCGGTFLCYEGAHKLQHRLRGDHGEHEPTVATAAPADASALEATTVASAVRTDLVLSAEIMVIALKDVLDESLLARVAILLLVAAAMTALVYGVVALIVKMDDVGLRLAQRGGRAEGLGRGLVTSMPKVLSVLSTVGTAAMLWVGGHILLSGAAELDWHTPEHLVHSAVEAAHEVAGIGAVLGWLVGTAISAVVGLLVGLVVVTVVVSRGGFRRAESLEQPADPSSPTRSTPRPPDHHQ